MDGEPGALAGSKELEAVEDSIGDAGGSGGREDGCDLLLHFEKQAQEVQGLFCLTQWHLAVEQLELRLQEQQVGEDKKEAPIVCEEIDEELLAVACCSSLVRGLRCEKGRSGGWFRNSIRFPPPVQC